MAKGGAPYHCAHQHVEFATLNVQIDKIDLFQRRQDCGKRDAIDSLNRRQKP